MVVVVVGGDLGLEDLEDLGAVVFGKSSKFCGDEARRVEVS